MQDLKVKVTSFDSQLAGDVPPKKYFPLIFDFEVTERSFEKYLLLSVFCDMIIAFQQSHKMTA